MAREPFPSSGCGGQGNGVVRMESLGDIEWLRLDHWRLAAVVLVVFVVLRFGACRIKLSVRLHLDLRVLVVGQTAVDCRRMAAAVADKSDVVVKRGV